MVACFIFFSYCDYYYYSVVPSYQLYSTDTIAEICREDHIIMERWLAAAHSGIDLLLKQKTIISALTQSYKGGIQALIEDCNYQETCLSCMAICEGLCLRQYQYLLSEELHFWAGGWFNDTQTYRKCSCSFFIIYLRKVSLQLKSPLQRRPGQDVGISYTKHKIT